jgi:hypothetical protein
MGKESKRCYARLIETILIGRSICEFAKSNKETDGKCIEDSLFCDRETWWTNKSLSSGRWKDAAEILRKGNILTNS